MVQGLVFALVASQDSGFGHVVQMPWAAEQSVEILLMGAKGTVGSVRGRPWKDGSKTGEKYEEFFRVGTDNGRVYYRPADSRVRLVSCETDEPVPTAEADVVSTSELEALCERLVQKCRYPIQVKVSSKRYSRQGDEPTGLVNRVSVQFDSLYKGVALSTYGGGSAEFEPSTGRLRVLYVPEPVRFPNSMECKVSLDEAKSVMIGECFKKGLKEYEAVTEPQKMILSIDPQSRPIEELRQLAWEKLPASFLGYYGVFRDKAAWNKDTTGHYVGVKVDAVSGKVVEVEEIPAPTGLIGRRVCYPQFHVHNPTGSHRG